MLKIEPQKDTQDATIQINNLVIYMLNRHLIPIKGELNDEKLLQPTRISLVYDKQYKSQEHKDITNIQLTIEPFDLKLGFREVENFKQFKNIMDDLLENLAKALNPLNTGVNVDKNEKEELKVASAPIPGSNTMTEEEKLAQLEDDDEQEIIIERIPMKDRKHKEIVKMIANVHIDSIIFSLMGKDLHKFLTFYR